MQEALDLQVANIQALITEKLDLETRSKADQRKAEDVRLPHYRVYTIIDAPFPQARFQVD